MESTSTSVSTTHETERSAPETRAGAVLRLAAAAVLLACALLLPFSGKGFTIDDTLFLKQAEQAASDPMHPFSVYVVWDDNVPTRVSPMSGPVMPWLLVPAVSSERPEIAAHLVQLVLLLLAAIATVALALRLGLQPGSATIAGVLLVATPAVLGMAGTAMADVPAMSLGVLALERVVAWRNERRHHQAAAAALLLGFAPLARSHLVLLLGIAALLLAGDFLADWRVWRSSKWGTWLPLAVAPVFTGAVVYVTRNPDAGAASLAATQARLSSSTNVVPNVIAFAVHWVAAFPLAIPWVLLRGRPMLRRWWALVLAVAVAALLVRATGQPAYGVAAMAAIGIAVLIDVFGDAWARRDAVQMTLGAWLLVGLAPAPYSHLPSKYLLAAAPAVAILVAREMSRHAGRWPRAILAIASATGVILGIAILRADTAFAGLGRRAAAELIAPNAAAGHRVWFAGHWGFQWYAEKAGGRILTLTPPYPVPGDLVVTSQNSEPGNSILVMLAQRYPRATHLARIEDATPGGRIMNNRLGAGFFSNGWGYLPWAWGDDVIDRFDLWRIE